MLSFLFRGLTTDATRGDKLFDALTAEARRPIWFRDGGIADTLDGRFAVLATIIALAMVRLEADGEAGTRLSVALTERFVAVMESEHRELGLGDPTLGKTVRRLVGMLARRTEILRNAGDKGREAARDCLYKSDVPAASLNHSIAALARLNQRLAATSLENLELGRIA